MAIGIQAKFERGSCGKIGIEPNMLIKRVIRQVGLKLRFSKLNIVVAIGNKNWLPWPVRQFLPASLVQKFHTFESS